MAFYDLVLLLSGSIDRSIQKPSQIPEERMEIPSLLRGVSKNFQPLKKKKQKQKTSTSQSACELVPLAAVKRIAAALSIMISCINL